MDKIQNGDKFSVVMDKTNKAIEHCVPTGCIMPYAGTSVPDGWLLCDGAQYSISQYYELANILGYTANSNYFRVPDLRNKYLKGNTKSTDSVTNDNGTLWVSKYQSGEYDGSHTQSHYAVFSIEPGKFELPFVGLNFIIKY